MIFVNLYSCVPLHVEYIYIYTYIFISIYIYIYIYIFRKAISAHFFNVISYIETTYP